MPSYPSIVALFFFWAGWAVLCVAFCAILLLQYNTQNYPYRRIGITSQRIIWGVTGGACWALFIGALAVYSPGGLMDGLTAARHASPLAGATLTGMAVSMPCVGLYAIVMAVKTYKQRKLLASSL